MNIDDDYMLFVLNTLGQTYNSSSGFNVKNKIIADITDIKFLNLIEESFNKGYRIKNHEGYNFYDLSEINNNDHLYFDIKFLEEKSKMNVIYDLVILKYQRNFKNNKGSKITISSLRKFDSITIEDILCETSNMITDKNKMCVDFKYKKIYKAGSYRIVLGILK